MQQKSQSIQAYLLTFVVLGFGLHAGLHAQQAPASTPTSAAKPSLSVQLQTVASQNLDDTLQVNGSIAPWQEMSVGSEASGLRVTEVLGEVGQTVKKGQVLARFDAETIQADLLAAQAAVMEAQASLDNAKATADMVRSIKEPGAYTGIFPMDTHKSWEKTAATLRQLVDLRSRVRELEKALQNKQQNKENS